MKKIAILLIVALTMTLFAYATFNFEHSQIDIKKGCSKIDVALGIILSLTPFPLYFFIVVLIANAKHFTFI